jgi:hypothetical protein
LSRPHDTLDSASESEQDPAVAVGALDRTYLPVVRRIEPSMLTILVVAVLILVLVGGALLSVEDAEGVVRGSAE